MTLMTAAFIASTLFVAQGEGSEKEERASFVVAVCTPSYLPDSPSKFQLKPLGAFVHGSWLSSEFFPVTIFPKRDKPHVSPFRPEQNTFLESLLNKKFYLCADPAVTFVTEEKMVSWMIDSQYLGLSGQLKGTIAEDDEEVGTFDEDGGDGFVAMTNIREACGTMKPAMLSEAEEALLSKRAQDAIIASVKESMRECGDKKIDARFDPSRYYAPKVTRVLLCQLPSGWTGLWVRVIMNYPPEASPKSELTNNSDWFGYYSCLLQTKPKANNPILWEYADSLCSGYGGKDFDLYGIFDGDKDDVPELAICKHGHEYCQYMLAQAENGELVEISSITGAL